MEVPDFVIWFFKTKLSGALGNILERRMMVTANFLVLASSFLAKSMFFNIILNLEFLFLFHIDACAAGATITLNFKLRTSNFRAFSKALSLPQPPQSLSSIPAPFPARLWLSPCRPFCKGSSLSETGQWRSWGAFPSCLSARE